MFEIVTTEIYNKRVFKLKDNTALLKIDVRLERLKQGNFGDVKSAGTEFPNLEQIMVPAIGFILQSKVIK